MKKSILIAALLSMPVLAPMARADQLFTILTPGAGNIQFTGTGTAQFNNQLGTQNNFNVGSSTNIGVNASAAGTYDYDAAGSALLQLGGTSQLQQTIGTSTAAANVQQATTSASNVAYEQTVQSMGGSSWSTSWAGNSNYDQTKVGWEAEAKAGWESEWKNKYSTAYSTAFSSANTNSASTDKSGIINAEFSTNDTGAGLTTLASMKTEFDAAASSSADMKYGSEWSANWNPSVEYSSEADSKFAYEQAYAAEYKSAYANAYSNAAGMSSRDSTSEVNVTGIGVIANINAASTSNFKADVSKLLDTNGEPVGYGNGNGNASGAASLSTSSFANQSNNVNASAFMQAFSSGSSLY